MASPRKTESTMDHQREVHAHCIWELVMCIIECHPFINLSFMQDYNRGFLNLFCKF